MSLLELIVVFVVVGLALYLINRYIPMEPRVKQLMNIAVIIVLVLWLLRVTGLLNSLSGIRIGGVGNG
jgi:hypothetical protein